MFKFNRQLGYAAINLPLFNLSFYLIWGWFGNIAYYRRRAILYRRRAILIDCSPIASARHVQPLHGTIRGTHLSPNLESLSGGFVERNPQLGVSIARNTGEEMSSPTLLEAVGSPGRVSVSVTGNGLDYTIPAHRQLIDEMLEQDSLNIVPNLRSMGIDWVNGWNSIGADAELHVLNPRAITIVDTQRGPLRQFLDEAARYRVNSPLEGDIPASRIMQAASDLAGQDRGLAASLAKALGLNAAGRFVGLLRLTLHSNGLETVVYMRRLLEWDWNSEHIAAWWGENHEATGYSPEYASYQGWLGSHYYV